MYLSSEKSSLTQGAADSRAILNPPILGSWTILKMNESE
jgi:hypothetical protein